MLSFSLMPEKYVSLCFLFFFVLLDRFISNFFISYFFRPGRLLSLFILLITAVPSVKLRVQDNLSV